MRTNFKSRLPVIETERLIIREIEAIDAEDFYEYGKIVSVGDAAGWEAHFSKYDSKMRIEIMRKKSDPNYLGLFSIILKSESKMIGTVELHSYLPKFKAELGYTVNPRYWGNSYAVEASKTLLKWGFEDLGLKRIECSCYLDNLQSMRVCEKLLFTNEGIKKRGYINFKGECVDIMTYALTIDEYYERYKK